MNTTSLSSDETIAIMRATLPSARFDQVMGWINDLNAYKAGRQAGGKAVSQATGKKYQVAIAQVLEHFDPPYKRQDILDYMYRYQPSHFGLKEFPCERTVSKYLKALS